MNKQVKRWLCVMVVGGVMGAAPVWAAEEITVYAAASLTNALGEIEKSYEANHGVNIKTSFAASSTLAKQIEAGAPAHLFMSADTQWMDYLQKRGKVSERKDLLGNTLVLIAPVDKPFNVTMDKSFDLAGAFSGRLCTGEPESVPVGIYGKQALKSMGWWSALEKRVVGTEDVRTTLAFIERAQCPVGIVYDTDAKISDKVTVIARFPASSHSAIVYPAALLNKAPKTAQAFYQHLQSPEAKAVLVKYGFKVLGE